MSERRAAVRPHFLRACRGESVDRVPVWFMRQAGRSLPEYRRLRERHSTLELIGEPELAAEVTLQPLRRYDVDAAILFSDIVVPLQAMGIDLTIEEGVGPVIAEPIRAREDLDRLRPLEVEGGLAFVLEAISILTAELDVPLIGFAGAPFTLACYLVEGGPSKDYARTKALMLSEPDVWKDLMERLADATRAYLSAQIAAGVSAVQLFDSWVGALSRADFEHFVRPTVEGILKGLKEDVPRIYFGVNTSELLASFPDLGADVVGVDHRVTLREARERVGPEMTLQGNLDPAACLAPWEVVEERAFEVLRQGGGRQHVFNLGHGVLPQTDPATLARLTDLVHGWEMHG
jgi:uroporphyrinogen decarboxylase